MELKVGEKVTVYKVVSYMDDSVTVEHDTYAVDGDANGEPLCLRLDTDDHKRTGLANYGSQAVHFHEVSFSEEEAVRRWRAEKLVEAVKAEQRAKSLRDDLAKPIRCRGTTGFTGRYVPEGDSQVKMRFEER